MEGMARSLLRFASQRYPLNTYRFIAPVKPIQPGLTLLLQPFQSRNWSKQTRINMSASYHCVYVFIKVKPGTEEAFKNASLMNARNSAKEPGVARFDVLQDQDDPSQFVLVEVYKDAVTAPVQHKETTHYAEWRDTVADMMAEPRSARKFNNLFPTTSSGWEYPATDQLE